VLELECVLELRLVDEGVKVLGALVEEVVTFGVLVTTGVLVTVDVVTVLCDTASLRVFCLALCFSLGASFADVVPVTFAGTVTVPTCDPGACVL
jgi:hypothetical protein